MSLASEIISILSRHSYIIMVYAVIYDYFMFMALSDDPTCIYLPLRWKWSPCFENSTIIFLMQSNIIIKSQILLEYVISASNHSDRLPIHTNLTPQSESRPIYESLYKILVFNNKIQSGPTITYLYIKPAQHVSKIWAPIKLPVI